MYERRYSPTSQTPDLITSSSLRSLFSTTGNFLKSYGWFIFFLMIPYAIIF